MFKGKVFTFAVLFAYTEALLLTDKDVCNQCKPTIYKSSNSLPEGECCGITRRRVLNDMANLYSTISKQYTAEFKDLTRNPYISPTWNCKSVSGNDIVELIVRSYNTIAVALKTIVQHTQDGIKEKSVTASGLKVMCDLELFLKQKGELSKVQKNLTQNVCLEIGDKPSKLPVLQRYSIIVKNSLEATINVVLELHETLRCSGKGVNQVTETQAVVYTVNAGNPVTKIQTIIAIFICMAVIIIL